MKRIITTTTLLLIALIASASQIKQENRMYSRILNDTVMYAIYLPTGYETNERSYPTFYLLHGLSDDYRSWSQQGDIQRITDQAVEEGKACDMIIVMPDGKDHWYVNSFDGKVRYEDMFFQELIPHIDSTYRTRREREFRAIAGLSMGGQGALLYSIKHPDIFATCGAMSSAVYTDKDIIDRMGAFPQLFERIYGKGMPTEHWKKNNVLNLAETMPDNQKNAVKFWIDCGDDDFLYRGNAYLHLIMRDKKITHQFRVRDGGHGWRYWQDGIQDIIQYVTKSFLRQH